MPDEPLTVRELRDALAMHARMSRSRGSSYEEVAREIGFLVVVTALVWVLVGAPGVPAVAEFAETYLKPRLREGLYVLLATGVADVVGQSWYTAPSVVTSALLFPARVVSRLTRAVVLLSGIGCIGIAALLPGAFIVHLLGLNAG